MPTFEAVHSPRDWQDEQLSTRHESFRWIDKACRDLGKIAVRIRFLIHNSRFVM